MRCPTLLVVGALDLICGPRAEMLARAMPEVEVVTIEDRGHFIPAEAPEPIRAALVAFCNTHPVGPAVRV